MTDKIVGVSVAYTAEELAVAAEHLAFRKSDATTRLVAMADNAWCGSYVLHPWTAPEKMSDVLDIFCITRTATPL